MVESVLMSRNELSRRRFLVTTLSAGFALAVRPVRADTITTDAGGLLAGGVRITVPDGAIPAYRAKPASGKKPPVVLVVQEIFGVHEHIKDVCRRLAKRGYLAVAPELYARQGDVSKVGDIQQIISQIVSKVPDRQVMDDLDATVTWAKSSGEGDTGKLGITGFCWGGRIVWLYAGHNRDLKAGVAWYGRLVDSVEKQNSEVKGALSPLFLRHWLTGHGKTVFRGGYRFLYDPPFYNIYLNISTSAPEVFLQTFSGGSASTKPLPSNPIGTNVRANLAPFLQKGVFDPRTFTQTQVTPNFGPDKVSAWSFGVEREITKNSAIEARYAGNHAYNLFQTVNGNRPPRGIQKELQAKIESILANGKMFPVTEKTIQVQPSDHIFDLKNG